MNPTIQNALPLAVQNTTEGEINTVNSRDLHTWLGVGRNYNAWIKGRIDKYDFEQDVDYIIVQNSSTPDPETSNSRSQIRMDYYVTLDMAKELCMVENNDKGREARRYFIECERKLAEAISPRDRFMLDVMKAQDEYSRLIALNDLNIKYIRPLEEAVEESKPKVKFYDTVTQQPDEFDMNEVAKLINRPNFGRNKLTAFLRAKGIFRANNQPYQKYIDRGLFSVVEVPTVNGIKLKPVATQKGISFIMDLLDAA